MYSIPCLRKVDTRVSRDFTALSFVATRFFWGWSKPAPAINRLSSNELPVSPRSYELPGCCKLVAKTIVLVMFFNPNEIKQ